MGLAGKEFALKSPAASQLALLGLQEVDTLIDQLDHRERALPESIRLAELDERLTALQDDVVTAQTEMSDLADVVAKAEREVEQVRARARRDQELLDSGSISSSRQLEELQHEISSLARRQTELEDAELEVMEEAETAQNQVAALTAAIASARSERESVCATRDEAVEKISAERTGARADRDAIAARIPADLMTLYERLRAANGGVGAAPLRSNRCEGCHMQISPTERNRITTSDPNEVHRCEDCSRILVRADS